MGVTFVIATGGIDFSIGAVMFCSALISGYCLTKFNLPLWLCLFVSIAVGAVFGSIGGYFVAFRHLPSFITSLALMQVAKGVGSHLHQNAVGHLAVRTRRRRPGTAIW